jgi:HAD superfamily phosphatase
MDSLSNVALVFDIDGVIRDVAGSYRRALADTVEYFTAGNYRPTPEDIDSLKSEGIWNNDWEASQELISRYRSGKIPAPKSNQPDNTHNSAHTTSASQASKSIATATLDLAGATMPEYEEIVLFFQQRYKGKDPEDVASWSGYITKEPLIANQAYFRSLDRSNISWGFFSGATRSSAMYVLNRLAITDPALIAMEDAPGKPDPTGLLMVAERLGDRTTVIYAGDTAADMLTIVKAREVKPNYNLLAVGILPPHVVARAESQRQKYEQMLLNNGADLVLSSILELTPETIHAQISQ